MRKKQKIDHQQWQDSSNVNCNEKSEGKPREVNDDDYEVQKTSPKRKRSEAFGQEHKVPEVLLIEAESDAEKRKQECVENSSPSDTSESSEEDAVQSDEEDDYQSAEEDDEQSEGEEWENDRQSDDEDDRQSDDEDDRQSDDEDDRQSDDDDGQYEKELEEPAAASDEILDQIENKITATLNSIPKKSTELKNTDGSIPKFTAEIKQPVPPASAHELALNVVSMPQPVPSKKEVRVQVRIC
jgi:hypothetical protein